MENVKKKKKENKLTQTDSKDLLIHGLTECI